eukprot:gene31853-35954_t
MHIGEVAQRTELSLRTLRHYDEIGLVRPSGRTDGGFRLYAESDVDKILVIRRMKPLGFSLEQMAEVMEHVATLAEPAAATSAAQDARERMAAILAEALERRATLERQLAMADEFIALIRERTAPGPATSP